MRILIVGGVVLAFSMTPAAAEVVASSDSGFVVRQATEVAASAEESWAQLVKPADWWNGRHSYSGDAANLSLDALAGGCFCEVLLSQQSPRAEPRGSVEHMRVVYAEQPRVLRLSGALGPLQSEAVNGTLTIALKPVDGGTRIMWEYVVGGYMRPKIAEIGAAVDALLGEQMVRFAAKLGSSPAAPLHSGPAAPLEGR